MNPNKFRRGEASSTINTLLVGKKYLEAFLCGHLVIENQIRTLLYHESLKILEKKGKRDDTSRWDYLCDFGFSKLLKLAYIFSIIDKNLYSGIKAINTYRNKKVVHGLIHRTWNKPEMISKIKDSIKFIKKLSTKIKENTTKK